jgi:hypothetical protein
MYKKLQKNCHPLKKKLKKLNAFYITKKKKKKKINVDFYKIFNILYCHDKIKL